MKEWRCTLEVVTPLFLAGADQSKAELRPPAFKGLLRWWYRAAKGVITSEEGLLFGTTERASKWRLRLRPKKISQEIFVKDDFNSYPGLLYFGFSLDTRVRGELKRRAFISPGSTFQLELSVSSSATPPEEKALLASLWLLLWLGGIGSRCRRGFGSVRLKDAGQLGQQGLPFVFQGDLKSLSGFLQENLSMARDWIGHRDPGVDLPEFTVLASRNSSIYLWNTPFTGWQEALDQAGRILMDYRRRKLPDYEQVKDFLRNSSHRPSVVERAAFGLPIQFYFRSVEREKPDRAFATATVTAGGSKGGRHERRASPLFVKVLKINDRQYALLFLLMKARILEDGEKVKIETKGRPPVFMNQPSFRIIEEFLKEKVAPHSWEIRL